MVNLAVHRLYDHLVLAALIIEGIYSQHSIHDSRGQNKPTANLTMTDIQRSQACCSRIVGAPEQDQMHKAHSQ